MPIGAVDGIELIEVHPHHRIDHKPSQVVLGQPLTQRGRQQKRLLTTTLDEVLGHSAIVIAAPDGGVCATAVCHER